MADQVPAEVVPILREVAGAKGLRLRQPLTGQCSPPPARFREPRRYCASNSATLLHNCKRLLLSRGHPLLVRKKEDSQTRINPFLPPFSSYLCLCYFERHVRWSESPSLLFSSFLRRDQNWSGRKRGGGRGPPRKCLHFFFSFPFSISLLSFSFQQHFCFFSLSASWQTFGKRME